MWGLGGCGVLDVVVFSVLGKFIFNLFYNFMLILFEIELKYFFVVGKVRFCVVLVVCLLCLVVIFILF